MSTYKIFLEKYAEFGVVEEIYHPVVMASGLPSVHLNEIVLFENNQKGQILSISRDRVEILVLSRHPVDIGSKIARTGKPLTIPLGEYLLGGIVDPLGGLLTAGSAMRNKDEDREVDIPPLSILERTRITDPLLTGITSIDTLLPLGRGQRELLTGDRKTGKSSFLLTVIKHQIQLGAVAVYAAIGKKSIEIEQFRAFFEKQGLSNSLVIVATTSIDAPSLIYLTPFSAMTIAEYLRDLGKHVLIVLDDLSTHAKFYRELSLLARRFPGRDSYPGDIFFTHARLLERAGNYKHAATGEASISCLPVAETVENDLTDYIVSNLISITDGHLLFDTNEFIKGRRPAVNPFLSVTRVGKQTRTSLHQDINQRLIEFLGTFEKSQSFSHFGAELTDEIKAIIKRGQSLNSIFNQAIGQVIPSTLQILFISMVWLGWLEELSEQRINDLREDLVSYYHSDDSIKSFLDNLMNVVAFNDLLQSLKENKSNIEKIIKISIKSN